MVGCTPYLTYEQLSEEARVTGDDSKVEKFEATARRAEIYYMRRFQCNGPEVMWFCDSSFRERQPDSTWNIDQMVKAYRRDHAYCSCVNKDAQLREMRKMLGLYN